MFYFSRNAVDRVAAPLISEVGGPSLLLTGAIMLTPALVQHAVYVGRVSSVLNRDVKQFGKKHLFDGNDETCWNSDQGTPQWIQLDFNGPVRVQSVHIQFQGGFTGKDCYIEGTSEDNTEKLVDFYPDDINSNQVFDLPASEKVITSLRIIFSSSTDFFGRITIYKLDILGTKVS